MCKSRFAGFYKISRNKKAAVQTLADFMFYTIVLTSKLYTTIMKKMPKNYAVLALSNESFKSYLIQRYWNEASDVSTNATQEVQPQTWTQLYHRAYRHIYKAGGVLIGFELVNGYLVSHHCRAHMPYWPDKWMWVLKIRVVET